MLLQRSARRQPPRREARTRDSKPLSLDDILTIGLGELGMDPDTLYDYTVEEFMFKLEGYRNAAHLRNKDDWERMRELAFTVAQFSGNMKKGATKYMVMPFSWDEARGKSHIANLTGEERREAAKALIEERQKALQDFLSKRQN